MNYRLIVVERLAERVGFRPVMSFSHRRAATLLTSHHRRYRPFIHAKRLTF
jgi:hypothetical protein